MSVNKIRTSLVAVSLLLSMVLIPAIQPIKAEYHVPPQDTGLSGLVQMLQKLKTTARMIHTTAHPDDEDGGMLTYESRGVGASVLLFTLNRGEGGQNKTGSELFDALGILRTEELLAADSYYGVDERFSKVVDFGYSKNWQETLDKWKGQDTALEDMVRVIRTYKPDVLVSRFQGNASDGHGHHEAAGILTPIAFKAAADPNRFPDQITKEGLLPWQVKKLYMGAGQNGALRIDTGIYDPALGMSYAQYALEGLSHQLSQGSGGGRVPPGPRYSTYRLADSVINTGVAGPEHEQNFFDGIDTSLPGLASRVGNDTSKLPSLRQDLTEIANRVDEASGALTFQDPSRAGAPLLAGLTQLRKVITQVKNAGLSPAVKSDLLVNLQTKEGQFEEAANLALGVTMDVLVDAGGSGGGRGRRNQQSILIAIPGQTFNVTARLYNRGKQTIDATDIKLETPQGWQVSAVNKNLKAVGPNGNASVQFQVTVPENAQYTRPYFHRNDNQIDTIYKIDRPEYQNLPFPPYPVHASATYKLGADMGEERGVAEVSYTDPMYGQERRPLAIGPAISVELQPATQVIATDRQTPSDITVGVRNNVPGNVSAILKLEVPAGWKCEPASLPVTFTKAGEFNSYQFKVTPNEKREEIKDIKAVVDYNGKKYDEGYTVVTREDLPSFYYYSPAIQKVSSVDVAILQNLKIGYVMGAGDTIPTVLKQIGVNVELITPSELASGDLSRFDTIIMGIRAYDVRSDVRDNNKRLLDYVQRGGTLIVQYNQSMDAFNSGNFTPYPATVDPGNKRVTVEEAPVDILQPKDSVFLYPNKITPKDFDNWIQERGAYFMGQWDEHFKALMASHDPGEQPLEGGLLRAQYGKGTYIFSGYAFFRQLPAGVPGATRLFINILSAGHDQK
ncbi:MAG TPA: PIG-L family deacetylase [Blastocatellia bacterium]|nr:PIG-L family deacetylase [Blastocatellia bacterium]